MMDDDRTADQRSADSQLCVAVENVVKAYAIAPAGKLDLGNFIVIGNGFVGDDDGVHRIYYKTMKNGGIELNLDECQGMLHRASQDLDREYFDEGEQLGG